MSLGRAQWTVRVHIYLCKAPFLRLCEDPQVHCSAPAASLPRIRLRQSDSHLNSLYSSSFFNCARNIYLTVIFVSSSGTISYNLDSVWSTTASTILSK
jgi:hypothetical protein